MSKANMILRLRSWWGRLMGYSGCLCCKLAWNVVDGFMIPFTHSKSMFPICEKCFNDAPIKEIEKYIDQLVDLWDNGGNHNGMDYNAIRRNAKNSARELKSKENK